MRRFAPSVISHHLNAGVRGRPIFTPRFIYKPIFGIAALIVLIGCGGPAPQTSRELPPTVVARYQDQTIEVEELDAFVMDLPPRERPLPGQDLDAWYRDQARELILQRLLFDQAKQRNLDQEPAFLRSRREAARNLTLQLYFRQKRSELTAIDQQALEAAYESRRELLKTDETRNCLHLFRRVEHQAALADARVELSRLRDRVLNGENFRKLAAKYSDSEARHREGAIGWIRRGLLEPAFEDVIFSLEEGVPSEPVVADGGVHLFYVDSILPEKELSLEDAKPKLLELLQQERITELIDRTAAAAPIPDDALFVDRATFVKHMQGEDKEALILSLGESQVTVDSFRQALFGKTAHRGQPGSDRIPMEQAWRAYEQNRKLMLIDYQCHKENLVSEAELQKELEAWERKALVAEQRRLSLMALAEEDEIELERFYQNNLGRFSNPLQLKLRQLRIPLDERAPKTMAALETAAGTGLSLDQVAERHGGQITDLDWKTIDTLRKMQSKAPLLVANLTPGQLSPPYRSGNFIEMLEVLERREAAQIPFEEARQRIPAFYVDQYTPKLYQRLQDRWVSADKLEINPRGLARLRADQAAESDVDVEEIEALLKELKTSW